MTRFSKTLLTLVLSVCVGPVSCAPGPRVIGDGCSTVGLDNALAEACEQENGSASALADALFLTAGQVNQAHVSALAWAQHLEI